MHLLFGKIDKVLEKLAEWFRSNQFSLNVYKTKYIVFTWTINNAFNGDQYEIILTNQK